MDFGRFRSQEWYKFLQIDKQQNKVITTEMIMGNVVWGHYSISSPRGSLFNSLCPRTLFNGLCPRGSLFNK